MKLTPQQQRILAILLFPVLLWVISSLLFSFLSGWPKLWQKFGAKQKPYGTAFLQQSGLVGKVCYQKVINIYNAPEGLFITAQPLFSLGNPPLFIPWREISLIREGESESPPTITVAIGNPPLDTMTLPKAIFAGHINAMQRAPANLENNVAHDQPGAFIFIFIIAFWCFISLFLSFIGGWQQLARQYKTTESPYGKAYNSQSGAVGWVSYNNCLFIRTTPNGLFIAVMFLFRIGHPTLFIPWNDIQFLKETNFLWYHTVKIGVGNPQITTMTLPKKIFDETAGGTGS